ncbi:MAG: hypothetical protein AAGA53_13925 [Pseudomonadota bacterium]
MFNENTMFWLKIGSAIVMGFGLLGVLGSLTAMDGVTGFFADLAFWPYGRATGSISPEVRLLWGICGGLMAGWGLMMWMLATKIYPKEPELARSIILTSVITWFLFDSTGSALAGAPMNVVYNVGFLLLFVVPLWNSKTKLGAH